VSENEKRLFLVDGMPVIYKAHFAFLRNPIINSKGEDTSAIYGYTNSIYQIIQREKPTHLAVVFDTKAPTFRHKEYPEYKANREAMPEELSRAIPEVFKITEAMNIPLITCDGWEADDIIGTLAKQASTNGYKTYMVTPDKDYAQLVDKNSYLYKPGKAGDPPIIMGVKEVKEKWGVKEIKQVIDILGLMGDKVDNIPGIPGIGEKTATKLIQSYGSVEAIIANANELKGKQKENVETFGDQGILSKKLATIITEAPVSLKIDSFSIQKPNQSKLRELFTKYEFNSLAKRILKDDNANIKTTDSSKQDSEEKELGTYKSLKDIKHKYHLIETEKEHRDLISVLNKQKSFCFDTETTGLNTQSDLIIGIAISFKKSEGYYIPVPKTLNKGKTIITKYKEIFENEKIEKIGHNLKFDIAMLNRYEINIKGKIFDTLIAHYLIEPDQRHKMDILAQNYLNRSPIPITELIGEKKSEQLNMSDIPLEKITEYAVEDADITLQLSEIFKPIIKEKSLEFIMYEIEIPLIAVLIKMENNGIKINESDLQNYSKELTKDINRFEKMIYKEAEQEFNINSPKQLGEILFDKLQLVDKPKKTKTGQYATNEEILTRLANSFPIAKNILEYRTCKKLKSTYVDALPEFINSDTQRIHTSYNQAVAVTGRMQSQDPNLQNIPIRTNRGKEIRKAFIPKDKSHQLLSADYSQIELRVIAEISGDKSMIEAFQNKVDIHLSTASKVFGVQMQQVTDEMRRQAKTVNFGIIYGISVFGLSQRLNIPRGLAKELIENYFKEYPGIKSYMETTIEFARKNGFVETIMGRKRYLKMQLFEVMRKEMPLILPFKVQQQI